MLGGGLVVRALPDSGYLIFHFKCPQALVDCVHDFITLVTASPTVKAGNDDVIRAGQVCGPVQLELVAHPLTAGAAVPAEGSEETVKSIHTHTW